MDVPRAVVLGAALLLMVAGGDVLKAFQGSSGADSHGVAGADVEDVCMVHPCSLRVLNGAS